VVGDDGIPPTLCL